jgi:hypothetical protein
VFQDLTSAKPIPKKVFMKIIGEKVSYQLGGIEKENELKEREVDWRRMCGFPLG